MGNTWEVWAYVPITGVSQYDYVQVWRGQHWLGCVRAAIKAKRAGAGCVKIEWRS